MYHTMTIFTYSKAAEGSSNAKFEISGSDYADIADQYFKRLDSILDADNLNFTPILGTNRTYHM